MNELRHPINPEQKGDGVKATKTNQTGQLLLSMELHKGQYCVDFQEIAGVEGEGRRMQMAVELVSGLWMVGGAWNNFWISTFGERRWSDYEAD
jgi:hypothetical protein